MVVIDFFIGVGSGGWNVCIFIREYDNEENFRKMFLEIYIGFYWNLIWFSWDVNIFYF